MTKKVIRISLDKIKKLSVKKVVEKLSLEMWRIFFKTFSSINVWSAFVFSYCAKFRVTETRGACHRQSPGSDQPPPRTKALTVGATVCVECQPFGILQRTRSSKCIGDGIHMMETPWNAVTAPRCHGKWVMTSQHQTPCHCDATSETSFIFVWVWCGCSGAI